MAQDLRLRTINLYIYAASTYLPDNNPVHILFIYMLSQKPLPADFFQFTASFRWAVVMRAFNVLHIAFGDIAVNLKGRHLTSC